MYRSCSAVEHVKVLVEVFNPTNIHEWITECYIGVVKIKHRIKRFNIQVGKKGFNIFYSVAHVPQTHPIA